MQTQTVQLPPVVNPRSAVSRSALFSAFANGQEVALGGYRGRICKINLESGYLPGQKPRHFLVSLMVDGWGRVVNDLYVRTEE